MAVAAADTRSTAPVVAIQSTTVDATANTETMVDMEDTVDMVDTVMDTDVVADHAEDHTAGAELMSYFYEIKPLKQSNSVITI